MPVKAYTGLPRAGKSYEVVVYVILPALRQGRRVVSNIAGLNYGAMCQVLYAEGVPQEQIGGLVCVAHADVERAEFWRTDTDEAEGVQSFIQPGDVVALDEIWRFWKRRGDIHPRALNFFRMHGHFAHPETGYVCEVALITQDVSDVNENIRKVIEETYRMVKNTKLGSSKSYVVHVYGRASCTKSNHIQTKPPSMYKAENFHCYKSHSQRKDGAALAVEDNPDKRGSVFSGVFFRFVIPGAVLALGVTVWGLWHFFHRATAGKGAAAPVVAASAPALGVPAASVASYRRGEVPPGTPVTPAWRVVGFFRHQGFLSVLLVNAEGGVRSVDVPRGASASALGLDVWLPEGQQATSWTVVKTDKGPMK
jgi:zona occludens toxin